jgi:hypothetical protein
MLRGGFRGACHRAGHFGPDPVGSTYPTKRRSHEAKKGSGTPIDVYSNLRARRGTARAWRSALACRRSAAARTRKALARWAQLQARLPGTWQERLVRYASPNRGRKTSRGYTGVIRARLSQSSGSTPRTGPSASQHDARSRSGAACEAARKHRTRSARPVRIRNASPT